MDLGLGVGQDVDVDQDVAVDLGLGMDISCTAVLPTLCKGDPEKSIFARGPGKTKAPR